jgi:trk system potassium uptake protein TrkA
MGHDVLAVDIKEKTVQDISSRVTQAVQADATDEDSLKEMGISDFDIAIVAIGGSTIGESVLATILLKRLGVKFVIARAENQLHGVILEKVGADRVVYAGSPCGNFT